jgi:hypothetical protein
VHHTIKSKAVIRFYNLAVNDKTARETPKTFPPSFTRRMF